MKVAVCLIHPTTKLWGEKLNFIRPFQLELLLRGKCYDGEPFQAMTRSPEER